MPREVAAEGRVVGHARHRVLERVVVGQRVAARVRGGEVVERLLVVGEDRPAVDLAVHLGVVARSRLEEPR